VLLSQTDTPEDTNSQATSPVQYGVGSSGDKQPGSAQGGNDNAKSLLPRSLHHPCPTCGKPFTAERLRYVQQSGPPICWGPTNPSGPTGLTSNRGVLASLLHAESATPAQQSNAASTTPTSPDWPGMLGSANSSTHMASRHHLDTNASAAGCSDAGTSSSPTTVFVAEPQGMPRPRAAATLVNVGRRLRACHLSGSITDRSTRKLDDRGSRRHPRDRSGPRPLLAFTFAADDVGGTCCSFHGLSCWQESGQAGFLALLRRGRCRSCRSVDGTSHGQRMMAVTGCCCRLAELKPFAFLTQALAPVIALTGSINTRHPPDTGLYQPPGHQATRLPGHQTTYRANTRRSLIFITNALCDASYGAGLGTPFSSRAAR